MKLNAKISLMGFVLYAQLSFPASTRAEFMQTDDRPTPAFEPEKHSLTAVALSPVVVGGRTLGAVVVYDDPTTKRPADYFELYDGAGDLVAVAWFDRFGIQRMAVDRALLEGKDRPEGVFVSLLRGDSI